MKTYSLAVVNIMLFVAFTLGFSAMQCSLWLQLFGSFPPPHFWLPVLIYWSLYRSLSEAAPMAYLMAIIESSFSSAPISVLLFVNVLTLISITFLKSRFYWAGPMYFTLISGIASIFVPMSLVAVSWAVEKNPVVDLQVFEWVVRALLTMLVSLAVFPFFEFIDEWTQKARPKVAGKQIS